MMSRRTALSCLASMAITTPSLVFASSDQDEPDQNYADSESADQWMQQWIGDAAARDPGATKAPNGALHLGRFADPVYYLTRIIGWDPNPNQSNTYQAVRVPTGFVTDFASIPRIFWSTLRPDGLYSYAAVIHDYLYWEQYLPRETADQIFRLCMEDFKIDSSIIVPVYYAIRLGGGFAWESNKKLKDAGEKRILKRFPTDPTNRWAEWKMLPDVY